MMNRRNAWTGWVACLTGLWLAATGMAQQSHVDASLPFPGFPNLEKKASGQWWDVKQPNLVVPRDQVVAFALYTHDRGVLKLSAQLFPLKPEESRTVRLELQRDGTMAGSGSPGSPVSGLERPLPHGKLGQHPGHSLPGFAW